MRLLWSYLEKYGRPVSCYTDKASLFQTAAKIATRPQAGATLRKQEPLPPTQVGRALRGTGHTSGFAAHSPQAKGRVERSFGTAQDRLVKGLRVAGRATHWSMPMLIWNRHSSHGGTRISRWCRRASDDAHRPLAEAAHSLPASLSYVESRTGGERLHHPLWQQGLSDCACRDSAQACVALQYGSKSVWIRVSGNPVSRQQLSSGRPNASPVPRRPWFCRPASPPSRLLRVRAKSQWMKNFYLTSPRKSGIVTLSQQKPIR